VSGCHGCKQTLKGWSDKARWGIETWPGVPCMKINARAFKLKQLYMRRKLLQYLMSLFRYKEEREERCGFNATLNLMCMTTAKSDRPDPLKTTEL